MVSNLMFWITVLWLIFRVVEVSSTLKMTFRHRKWLALQKFWCFKFVTLDARMTLNLFPVLTIGKGLFFLFILITTLKRSSTSGIIVFLPICFPARYVRRKLPMSSFYWYLELVDGCIYVITGGWQFVAAS